MLKDYDWSWSRERFRDALERHRRWLEKWLLGLKEHALPLTCLVIVALVVYYGVLPTLSEQPQVQQTSGVNYGLAGEWQAVKEVAKTEEPQATEVLQPPCTGESVQDYGFVYSKRYGDYRFHDCITYIPKDDKVTAAMSGTVNTIKTGEKGRVVTLEHEGKMFTQYTGLSTVTVKEQQTIKQGEPLGSVVKELDFTVIVGQQSVDPKKFLGD